MLTKDELNKTINRNQSTGYLASQLPGLQHIQIFNSLWKASRFGSIISQRPLFILLFLWEECVIMDSGAEPTCLFSGNPNSYQRTMPYDGLSTRRHSRKKQFWKRMKLRLGNSICSLAGLFWIAFVFHLSWNNTVFLKDNPIFWLLTTFVFLILKK